MNAFLKSIAATLGLGAALALPVHANTNVPIQVFLVNLSPQAITSVTWTDATGSEQTSGTVESGGIIALGAMSVPETQTSSIGISQTASNGSPINASFTLSNNCGWETWQVGLALQATNPSSQNNASTFYSYGPLIGDNGSGGWWVKGANNTYAVCLSNNNQFALGNNNGYPGILSGCASSYADTAEAPLECPNWPQNFALYANFPSTYSSNMQSLVLGSYVPTGTGYDTSAAPAFWNVGGTSNSPGLTLSPTGLTTYIGTSVVVPYNGNDFSYWPVTIYYGVDTGGNAQIPLVQPTQSDCVITSIENTCTASLQLAEVYPPYGTAGMSPWNAVNVPSFFTDFQNSATESAYMPPNAGNTEVNGLNFPMPCWPLYDSTGSTGTFIGCNGAPQYVSKGSTAIAPGNTILSNTKNSVETVYYLIEIASVF